MIHFLTFLAVFVAVVAAFRLFQRGVDAMTAWFFPKYDPRRQERAVAVRLRDGRTVIALPSKDRRGSKWQDS